mmetsp:Transcript_71852/g.114415  ORF Transcript_71852/g.114415 Transcript_71852/m.114415 type:complete len:174 (-) Transcript_71852:297-818(-)
MSSGQYIGEIRDFATSYCPVGWAECRGQVLPTDGQYGTLFALIGSTHGGDGDTTFALPNIQRKTANGKGKRCGADYYWDCVTTCIAYQGDLPVPSELTPWQSIGDDFRHYPHTPWLLLIVFAALFVWTLIVAAVCACYLKCKKWKAAAARITPYKQVDFDGDDVDVDVALNGI